MDIVWAVNRLAESVYTGNEARTKCQGGTVLNDPANTQTESRKRWLQQSTV